uniref:Putative reg-2-like protein n=1 Tax=Culex tarsalis TaxID=7177 RepID=A0A1Q3FDC8_CULTA
MNSRLVAKNLARFKLVTFDVTDTLLRFSRPPEVQYALAARRHGCSDVDERALARCFRSNFQRMARDHPNFGKCSSSGNLAHWRRWWQTLVMDIFHESHAHLDRTKLQAIAEQLIEDYQTSDCWAKIDLADDVIRLFRTHSKQVGIISNFDPRLSVIIESMALPPVDFIVTSYEAGVQKPSRRIFELALDKCRTKVLPSEALHIGNTPKLDYLGAKQAGWASVLVNVEEKGVSLQKDINPRHVFKNFREFIHVLETVEIDW